MNTQTAIVPPPSPGRLHVLEVVGGAIVGGVEHWVERHLERLPRERFRFTVLCPFESPYTDRLRALGAEVLVAPMPDDPPWSTIQMAQALVTSGGVDLIHAHMPKAHLLAGIVGRLTGRPVLTTVHGMQLTTLDLEVHRATGSHLSVVCHPTYYQALGLGVGGALLSFEPNGVDTQVYAPRPGGAAGVRAALGLERAAPLIGFAGRLAAEKGPEVFVRAMMLLHSRRPEVHAVVVGEGEMAAEIGRLVHRFGLQTHVHLLGLRMDMPAVYNELDVFVLPSHSEAMPLALMEAMASGVAAVATRVGGVSELVEHGQTGWLVAPGDFDDIANRCDQMIGDEALHRRMAHRSRARAVERFDLSDSVSRVGALLTRLARQRTDPQRLPAQGLASVR